QFLAMVNVLIIVVVGNACWVACDLSHNEKSATTEGGGDAQALAPLVGFPARRGAADPHRRGPRRGLRGFGGPDSGQLPAGRGPPSTCPGRVPGRESGGTPGAGPNCRLRVTRGSRAAAVHD